VPTSIHPSQIPPCNPCRWVTRHGITESIVVKHMMKTLERCKQRVEASGVKGNIDWLSGLPRSPSVMEGPRVAIMTWASRWSDDDCRDGRPTARDSIVPSLSLAGVTAVWRRHAERPAAIRWMVHRRLCPMSLHIGRLRHSGEGWTCSTSRLSGSSISMPRLRRPHQAG
jgi:hypothetical protein